MMVIDSLSAHPCFKTLDPESCRILDRHCTWLKAAAGAWVVNRTANDGNVYFVTAGRLRPAPHGTRRDLMSSDIEAGSFFGELGALEGLPRWHGVFAVNDSTVAAMPSVVFVETVFTHRPLGEAVVARLVARNRAMTRRVAEAAHIYESRLPFVGPMRSRPPYGRFHVGVDVRHIGGKHRRA
jgi:CRP/FNR family transcriptional regulator, cyclic AMP receptor protein